MESDTEEGDERRRLAEERKGLDLNGLLLQPHS